MAQHGEALPRRSTTSAARVLVRVVLVLAASLVVTLVAALGPTAPGRAAADSDHLVTGERLEARQSLVSPGGTAVLVVGDGRLTLLGPSGDALWSVGDRAGAALELDADGVLRLVAPDGTPVWAPDDGDGAAVRGARLEVHDDGDLVLLDADGAAVWSTGTGQRASVLAAGGVVVPGQPLTSPDGRHVLVVRRAGNVVLLGPDSRPRWSAGTDGRGAALALGADGALVVRDDAGRRVWWTHRPPVPGSTLVLHDDGDLVLVGPDGATVWSSGTGLAPSVLGVDDALAVGQRLDGPDGHLSLALTADGLVLRYDHAEVWRAPVTPGPGASLHVRSDGRVVLVDAAGAATWGTARPADAITGPTLRLDTAGALLTAGNGEELWRVDVPAELLAPHPQPADCALVDGPVALEDTVLTSHGVRVHPCLADAVDELFTQARAAGIDLAGSGWRSHEQQAAARARNCATAEDGTAVCRPPTAVPGTSRHERGLALDLTDHGHLVRRGTPAWTWLTEHAPPLGLHNLPSEPWHWSTDAA